MQSNCEGFRKQQKECEFSARNKNRRVIESDTSCTQSVYRIFKTKVGQYTRKEAGIQEGFDTGIFRRTTCERTTKRQADGRTDGRTDRQIVSQPMERPQGEMLLSHNAVKVAWFLKQTKQPVKCSGEGKGREVELTDIVPLANSTRTVNGHICAPDKLAVRLPLTFLCKTRARIRKIPLCAHEGTLTSTSTTVNQ